jgi:hypothetical protein
MEEISILPPVFVDMSGGFTKEFTSRNSCLDGVAIQGRLGLVGVTVKMEAGVITRLAELKTNLEFGVGLPHLPGIADFHAATVVDLPEPDAGRRAR